MIPSLNKIRSRRKLIELMLNRKAGHAGSDDAWDSHLRGNPADQAEAARLERLWDDLGKVPAPPLRLVPALPVEAAATGRRLGGKWALPLALAASLVLALGTKQLLLGHPPAGAFPTNAQHFAAGTSNRRLRLADGSILTLAPGAAVDITLRSDQRQIRLTSGEAYFEVVHDPARPFSVTTPFGTATDIGTAFDVRVDPTRTLVTVAEGSVRVTANGASEYLDVIRDQQVPLQLSADGQRATIGRVSLVDGKAASNWTSGWMRFEGMALGKVVEEVNLYSRSRIVLADTSRANVPVYAILKVGEIDGLMALAAAQPTIGPRALKVESNH